MLSTTPFFVKSISQDSDVALLKCGHMRRILFAEDSLMQDSDFSEETKVLHQPTKNAL